MTETRTYLVEGMSCEHCVDAVTGELSGIDGTEHVDVDLDAGTVTVTGDGVTDEAVAAAIDEVGYAYRGPVMP